MFDFKNIAKDSAPGDSEPQKSHRRKAECVDLSLKFEYRRAFCEIQLLEAMGGSFDFEQGHAYSFITGGDIDALTYLRAILRKKKLKYMLLSTWCMAAEDILQIKEWIKQGLLEKVDFYVGEIFKNQYVIEWSMLSKLIAETHCGRLCLFRNHSKILAGHDGGDFYFSVQSSANINTNPRTENACIIVEKKSFEFYKSYFDKIVSFA